MKFTLSWLKEHLDTTADVNAVAEKLTAIGLEVEQVVNLADTLRPFVVAEIVEATQHPDADRLRVCKVNTDEGEKQIVCGAPNARAGIKVALAKVGVKIPTADLVIKQSKIRGVDSSGMMCSARELGLGEDHAGIIELPADAKIGDSIVDVMGLNDPLIEIAITPNRGDCLGVYGIARDLAAAGLGTLKPLASPAITNSGACPVSIRIEDTDGCAMFVGRLIKGVKNAPSPEWLQKKLTAIGARPISALVDITNYFTFTYGRPLHVYDASKLNGGIIVRTAKAGETLDALNDKSYTLGEGMCAIADEKSVIGLGGIIGGVSTGCTESTTDVLLECAWFTPSQIAKTGQALALDSDARYRFERTVDPAFLKHATDLATQMILDLCGGTASDVAIAGAEPNWNREITLNPSYVNTLGGTNCSNAEIKAVLEKLSCTISGSESEWKVSPPSWRPDISQPADLVEEVLRIRGYDAIPVASLPKVAAISKSSVNTATARVMKAKRTLASRGCNETHTWAFISEGDAKLFGWSNEALRLINPISADLAIMRPSLLPNLLRATQYNADRGHANIALCEVGAQYHDVTVDGQQAVACAVRSGNAEPQQWTGAARTADVFDAKADAFAVMEACGFSAEKAMIVAEAPAWYHPGRSGSIKLGPKVTLAHFGEIHPHYLQTLGCKQTVVACEVFLDAIPTPKGKANRTALKASSFQAADRDFAFLMQAATPVADLLKAIDKAEKQLIQSMRVFDVYAGKGIEDGKKSVAVTVRLQAADRTLTDADIETVSKKIIDAAKTIGAGLR